MTDASDYIIPVHGEQCGLQHVAIEVRQNFLAQTTGATEHEHKSSRQKLKNACGRKVPMETQRTSWFIYAGGEQSGRGLLRNFNEQRDESRRLPEEARMHGQRSRPSIVSAQTLPSPPP